MKIIFSHGKESGPWGSKIKRLAAVAEAQGHVVESVDYRGMMDADARVEKLLRVVEGEADAFVLVGSSMGGYVSLVAAESCAPAAVFLLAPALYMAGYGQQSYRPQCEQIEIVHGWLDEVIPAENSIRFARESQCTLHLVKGNHRLNDCLDTVAGLFERFVGALED